LIHFYKSRVSLLGEERVVWCWHCDV